MRVVCPACAAAYEVPDALIGSAPRRLRCARCGEEWRVVIPSEAAAAPPIEAPPPPRPPAPEPAAQAVPAAPIRVPELRVPDSPYDGKRQGDEARAGGGAVLAWVLTVVVLAGVAAAAFVWRGPVMAAWPPSERVYAALGLAPK